jgi:D-alanyl-D-alanine carboxypeptidase
MTDAFVMFAKLISARFVLAAMGLAGALTCGLAAPSTASAQIPYLQMNAAEPKYAAIVIDANSGEMLYDKRADSPRYPASVTKVMTLYLTFEALSEGRLKLTDRVPFSPHAVAQAPTKLGLRSGDSISVDEAIRAMTVKSANDVAVAMAERLGGSEGRFAALMTLRGQELGMRQQPLRQRLGPARQPPDHHRPRPGHPVARHDARLPAVLFLFQHHPASPSAATISAAIIAC